jgi:hypothetical protein
MQHFPAAQAVAAGALVAQHSLAEPHDDPSGLQH